MASSSRPSTRSPLRSLKLHARSGGTINLPVVIRVPYAGGIGAIEHHSESPEVLFAHTAGLRVCTPATPQDGYDIIQQAIASPDPVLFFEPKARYWDKGEVSRERVAAQLDAPDGALLATAEMATRESLRGRRRHLGGVRPDGAARFAGGRYCCGRWGKRRGHRLALAVPLWIPTPWLSLPKKTGRVVVIHEANMTYGPGAEISARVTEQAFLPACARAPRWRLPCAIPWSQVRARIPAEHRQSARCCRPPRCTLGSQRRCPRLRSSTFPTPAKA